MISFDSDISALFCSNDRIYIGLESGYIIELDVELNILRKTKYDAQIIRISPDIIATSTSIHMKESVSGKWLDEISSFATSADKIATTDDSGDVKLFQLPSFKLMNRYKHKVLASDCVFVGDKLVSVGFDCAVQVFRGKKVIDKLELPSQSINPPFMYSVDTDGELVVVGVGDGSVLVLRVEKKIEVLNRMELHPSAVVKVLISNNKVFSASNDGTIAVTDLVNFNELHKQELIINNKKRKINDMGVLGSFLFVADSKMMLHKLNIAD